MAALSNLQTVFGTVSDLQTVSGIFGIAASLFFFLAPTITLKRIFAKKSTEQFSVIPYAMTILQCLLFYWYGLPPISENNKLVAVVNGIGAGIETIYVLMFITYAPKKEKEKFFAYMLIFLPLYVVGVSYLNGKSHQHFCGFAASIFSVIMYGSPFSIMRTVIKTKSVEFMPFFLSLSGFLFGACWFIFGLLGNDPFVYVSNGFGSILCALQLILYGIYRKNNGQIAPKDGGPAMEMELVRPPPENTQIVLIIPTVI